MMGSTISPPMRRLEMFKKALGTMGADFCVRNCVTLRRIFIMPSVAMNGGSRLLAIR